MAKNSSREGERWLKMCVKEIPKGERCAATMFLFALFSCGCSGGDKALVKTIGYDPPKRRFRE